MCHAFHKRRILEVKAMILTAGGSRPSRSAPQPVRPALEVVPYGHTVQCKLPVVEEYAPGVQRTQRYWPGCDLAKPGSASPQRRGSPI